jgi:hypothetical protein
MISIPTGPRAMNEHRPAYDLQAIRALLLDAFTAADLRRFCQDRLLFRPRRRPLRLPSAIHPTQGCCKAA